jgi:TolB-like protein
MKKILVVLSLLVFSCSTTSNYYSFDNALEMGTEKIQNDLPARAEVAILDFKSDNENLSAYVIEEMYDKLINFGKLSIMERSRTNTIAMEIGYQFSGEVDDSEIIKIGHQLGADYVVTGQIVFSGEAYRLRVFAIDIVKGRRVASSSLNINPNDRQINHLLAIETVENVNVDNDTIIINKLIIKLENTMSRRGYDSLLIPLGAYKNEQTDISSYFLRELVNLLSKNTNINIIDLNLMVIVDDNAAIRLGSLRNAVVLRNEFERNNKKIVANIVATDIDNDTLRIFSDKIELTGRKYIELYEN